MRSLKSTWATINDFAKAHRSGPATEEELSNHVDDMLQTAAQDEKVDMSAEMECMHLYMNMYFILYVMSMSIRHLVSSVFDSRIECSG